MVDCICKVQKSHADFAHPVRLSFNHCAFMLETVQNTTKVRLP